jgi:DMSO/TMAO reductase YedYZ molybdopterin-dependent catalytic subunit
VTERRGPGTATGERPGPEELPAYTPPPSGSKGTGALAGLIALGAGLGVAQLVAGFWSNGASPVVSVGEWIIDHVPKGVKDWAINTFATNDKLALIIGTLIVLILLSMWLGTVARRHLGAALVGVGLIGVVGALAALDHARSTWASALPSILGSVTSGFALAWLSGWRPASAAAAAPAAKAPNRAATPTGPDRRSFLFAAWGITAGALVAGGVGQALRRRYAVSGERSALVLPTTGDVQAIPATADLHIAGLTPFITPNNDFYRIDTALLVPQLSAEHWRLRVHGMVDHELELTFADLLKRPMIERDITLSCVSNEVGGNLVSNAVWRGARLADLLREAGVRPGATQLYSTSVDGFTCGTPVAAVMDGRDALLAVAMNGEPLPLKHGFPVRLVVPGLYGYVSATKWLVDLELTTWEREAYWVPRGWDQQAPIKTMSRIDVPNTQTVKAGRVAVAGVAWAPRRGISAVQVQIDDGPWQPARLGAVPSVDTWVQWVYEWEATPGDHAVTVRAVDGHGAVQPEEPEDPAPNGAQGYDQRGYHVNAA